jgi:hypothetical protein
VRLGFLALGTRVPEPHTRYIPCFFLLPRAGTVLTQQVLVAYAYGRLWTFELPYAMSDGS